MKLVLIGLGAFLVSLAISTAVVVMTHPEVEAPESVSAEAASNHGLGEDVSPSAATQSLAHVGATVAPIQHASDSAPAALPDAQPVSSAIQEADTAPNLGSVNSEAGQIAPSQTDDDSSADELAVQAAREESARQLARVFSAMRAEDAASVIKHMSNSEVIGVLKFFNSRTAGQVLSALDEARAAELSRELLKGGAGN